MTSERRQRAARPAWPQAALVALAILPAGGVARAQVAAPAGRLAIVAGRLDARRDSAEREAEALLHLRDSLIAERQRRARDTVRVQALSAVVEPVLAPLAREAVGRAWPVLEAQWGRPVLERTWRDVTINLSVRRSQFLGARVANVVADVRSRVGSEQTANLSLGRDSVASLADWIERTTLQRIEERLDRGTKEWLGRGRALEPRASAGALDIDNAFDIARNLPYVDLATAPAHVVRDCMAGTLARCGDALGLTAEASPRSAWFDEEDQRLVARSWWRGWKGRPRPEHAENPCVPRPMSAACRAFADSLPPRTWLRPLSDKTRASLVQAALGMGGTGAAGRLVADTAMSMAARLEAAAGRPLPELIAAWRAQSLATRPETVGASGPLVLVVLVTLAAGVGLAILVLTRRRQPA